jgi:hypothetical protein
MYILNNISFKNKTQAQAYAKKYITDEIPFFIIINLDTPNGIFLTELLSYHPNAIEKIGCGIKAFVKRKHMSEYILIILRTDGSEESFSYKYCCGQVFDDMATAMRSAIMPYTIEYKNTQPHKCNLCGIVPFFSQLHVDHKTIPFSVIKDIFLKKNNLVLPKSFSKNDLKMKCFKPEDKALEDSWIAYHNKIADYQMLCQQCNIKKGNKAI